RPPVDWSKVPVVITGTPNPEAIRLIVESIREFEYRELLKKQAAADRQRPAGSDQVVGDGFSISSQTG
ncbi:MAG TPA: hypothetical protein VHP14_17670, partial [Anaerolineales bacterium]|nr:hypothetical protein [Anaerolineales bacterium]